MPQANDRKLEGRLAAINLLNKTKQPVPVVEKPEPVKLDTDPIVEAIKTLSENRVDLTPVVEAIIAAKNDDLDLSEIIKAINNIELDATVDLDPLVAQLETVAKKPPTDFKPLVDKLDEMKTATQENTKVLSDLVEVAKSDKFITYDMMGRITKIAIKED